MLRLVIVTQDDPFYVPAFFREFIPVATELPVDVVGVAIQEPLGKKSLAKLIRQMFDFYGAWDFLRMGTRFAWFKALNICAVRLFHGHFPGGFSVEHVLLKHGWPILRVQNVNSPEFLEMIGRKRIDLLLSVAASQKFKPPLLTKPRLGCINVHTARLPKNRGMLPNFWALFHFDEEPTSAITVHRMNEELDDGPILLQEEFRLDPNESLENLIIRTKRLGAHAVSHAILHLSEGKAQETRNDRSQATYNTFPTRADVRRFRAKGLRLL